MKKQKILFILHLPPPVHGSSVVGKQIFESNLINEKFDCIFVNLSTSNQIDKIGTASLSKLFLYIKILFKIFSTLLSKKIDKVYLAPSVSKAGFFKDYIVFAILFLFRKKRIYHLHNKGVSKRKKSRFINFLYRSFFKNAKIILLSKLLYNDISEFVKQEDIYICPNGVNDEIIANKKKIISEKEPLNLLFLSNLIESKGPLVLLDACNCLKKTGVRFNCFFVGGEGDISKELFNQKVKKLNLQEHVFYLGKKYGEEKKQIFLNSDIFIFPTFYHNETFGLVNIEAMMYSLPVITTNEGGITDIVKDDETGYIIEQRNSKELANKITFLNENRYLIREFGEKGRNRFCKKFSLEVFERKLLDIIEQY